LIGQTKKLKVLVADRSSHARLVLEGILAESAGIEVTGLASDGDQLMYLLQQQKVDVVLASVESYQSDRLFYFKRIFSESPTPIVMLIEKDQLSLELLKEAIDIGVYGVVTKPGPASRPNYRSISDDIRHKVLAVRESEYWAPEKRLHMLGLAAQLVQPVTRSTAKKATAETIIVIGASTGGTKAVEQIVRQLDPNLNASVLIAIHLPPKFTHTYTRRLKELTSLLVIEGRTGLVPKPGKVIVAPGGRNMVVHSVMGNPANLKIAFCEEKTDSFDLPSVDHLMQAVAQSSVRRVVGVILTGMGKDGTSGAQAIFEREGGHVIAQDEATSAIFGMAKSAIESGYTDKVLPLSKIADYLNQYVAEQQQQVSTSDMNT
jgi:two-component system, chemotaxis family, protein-glutamate methylesterase/glutaminase